MPLKRLATVAMLADKALDSLEVISQYGVTLLSLKQVRKVRRQFERFSYAGFFNRFRELDRMCRAQNDHRDIQTATAFTGRTHTDSGVRIEHFAAFDKYLSDGFAGLLIINRQRIKQTTRFGPAIIFNAEIYVLVLGLFM